MVTSKAVNRILNDMEYFAMNFTHGTADESVVYQSLHQTYLAFVQMFYFNIALNNMPNGKQFYTNVIALYKIWYEKSENKKSEIITQGRKSIERGPMVDRLKD